MTLSVVGLRLGFSTGSPYTSATRTIYKIVGIHGRISLSACALWNQPEAR